MRLDDITYAIDLTQKKLEFHMLHKLAEKAAQRVSTKIPEGRLDEWYMEADRVHYMLNKALAQLSDFEGWDPQALDETPLSPSENMQILI